MTAAPITDPAEDVRTTALTILARLLKTEPDRKRLERLLTIALRVKNPPHAVAPASLARGAGEGGRGFARPGEGALQVPHLAAPAMRPTVKQSTPVKCSAPINRQPRVQTPEANENPSSAAESPPQSAIPDPQSAIPPLRYTPMTDDEFAILERQLGHTEAHRRRLIRAHIIAEQAREATDSS